MKPTGGVELRNVQYKGIWFTPDRRDRAFQGEVSFSEESEISLEAMGLPPGANWPDQIPTLLGVSGSGEEAALLTCGRVHMNEYGAVAARYRAKYLLVSRHISALSKALFGDVAVSFSGLYGWAGELGPIIDYEVDSPRGRIDYQVPAPIVLFENDEYTVSIEFELVCERSPDEGAHIQEKAVLRVRSAAPRDLDWFIKVIGTAQEFLTLTLGYGVRLLSAIGRTISLDQADVYFRPKYVLGNRGDSAWWRLQYQKRSVRMKDLFTAWIEAPERLRSLCDPYFSIVFGPNLPPEERFLVLARALESYHRSFGTKWEMPPEQYKARLDEIMEHVPETYREWLGDKLRYSNEPTLRRRLKELVGRCEELLWLFEKDELKRLVSLVVQKRNELTHPEGIQTPDPESSSALADWLALLIEVLLFQESGLNEDEMTDLMACTDFSVRAYEIREQLGLLRDVEVESHRLGVEPLSTDAERS